jgi:hypothetical protein
MWIRLPFQHVEVFLSELGTAKSSCQSSFSKHTLCLFDAMEHEPLDQPFIDDKHEPFTFTNLVISSFSKPLGTPPMAEILSKP